jgi:hypothetical protein
MATGKQHKCLFREKETVGDGYAKKKRKMRKSGKIGCGRWVDGMRWWRVE